MKTKILNFGLAYVLLTTLLGCSSEKSENAGEQDINDVLPSYQILGQIHGLNGGSLEVSVNGKDRFTLTGSPFELTAQTDTSALSLVIDGQPDGLNCAVINSSGLDGELQINDVIVHCQDAVQSCSKVAEYSEDPKDLSGNNVTGLETLIESIECGDEPWRLAADERITQHRKTDTLLTLQDTDGNPISNAKVEISLIRHDFNFGGIVQAKMWHGQSAFGVDAKLYQDTFDGFGFNKSGFQNGLKYKLRSGFESLLPDILQWLDERDIPVRGHTLIWPGWSNMESSVPEADAQRFGIQAGKVSELSDSDLKLYVDGTIKDWAQKWDLVEWDVANEIRGKQDVQQRLGYQEEAHWFKLAQQHVKNPGSLLFLNENRVISDTSDGEETERMQEYASDLDSILANGGPVDAIGFQSRFGLTQGAMLDANTMYKRLSYFDRFNLPISATEFEIKDDQINDEYARAQMTERIMRVYFSKSNVTDILVWTFFKSLSQSHNRHIVELDGSPNLRGKIWLYLVKRHWHTQVSSFANRDGQISFNGFKGLYQVSVTLEDGRVVSKQFENREDSQNLSIDVN